MNIPKCTLTDREVYDLQPPNFPFEHAQNTAFNKIRGLLDKYVEHMVSTGQLSVPNHPQHLFNQRNRND